MTGLRLEVEIDRLMAELGELAAHSDAPAPAVTRIVYSGTSISRHVRSSRSFSETPAFRSARMRSETRSRGGKVERPDLSAVATGSHIDAIPALRPVRRHGRACWARSRRCARLRRAGFRPVRPIEIVLFTSEEPTRFGIGCLGSRGALRKPCRPMRWPPFKDSEGNTLDELRRAAGFHGELADVRLPTNHYAAFIELHIEQGPVARAQRHCRSASSRRSPRRRRSG